MALLRVGMVAKIDPQTLAVTRFKEGADTSRSRRLDVLSDGTIWFGDEARGMLGRINPATGEVEGMAGARRRRGRPLRAHQGRSGSHLVLRDRNTKRLVGFDPKTEKFFANIEVSGTIRHMHFDKKTRMMWFGTDANKVGRIALQQREVSTTLAAAALVGHRCGWWPRTVIADGAPPGFSGGFKEESCHACHFHAEPNPSPGRVVIDGVPATFAPARRTR